MQPSCRRDAIAVEAGTPAARRIRLIGGRKHAVVGAACALVCAPPGVANAQVDGAVSVSSDYLLRGRTLSDGRAALTAAASYDDRSGAYGDVALVASTDHREAPYLLGAIGDVGYAGALASDWKVEGGLTRAQFAGRAGGRARGYTELHVGASRRDVSGRLHYSPDYFRPGNATLYAEVDAVVRHMSGWRIIGHVGLLSYRNRVLSPVGRKVQYDWQVGLARRVGRLDAKLAVAGGGPGGQFYNGTIHSRTTVVGLLSWPI